MPDFKKAMIYKLWSPGADLTFYGHTCGALRQRLWIYRSTAKKYEADKTRKYHEYFRIIECPDHRIDLVQYVECKNKIELKAAEGEIIMNNECLNR